MKRFEGLCAVAAIAACLAAGVATAKMTTWNGKINMLGEPIVLTNFLTVYRAIDRSPEIAGSQVQVLGKVTERCAKKGCWMVLRDGAHPDATIRVIVKDHAFEIPEDATGRWAIVSGTLGYEKVDEATRKHLAADKGQDPSTIQGDRGEWTVTAGAVAFLDDKAIGE